MDKFSSLTTAKGQELQCPLFLAYKIVLSHDRAKVFVLETVRLNLLLEE